MHKVREEFENRMKERKRKKKYQILKNERRRKYAYIVRNKKNTKNKNKAKLFCWLVTIQFGPLT